VAQTAPQTAEVETVALGALLGILVDQTVEVGTVESASQFGIVVAPVLPGILGLAVQPAAAAQIAAVEPAAAAVAQIAVTERL